MSFWRKVREFLAAQLEIKMVIFFEILKRTQNLKGLTMALKGEIDQDDVAVGVNALQEINKNVQESKTLYLYDYKYVPKSLLFVIKLLIQRIKLSPLFLHRRKPLSRPTCCC